MAADNDISAIIAMSDLSSSKGDYGRSLLLLRNALNQIEKSTSGDLKQRLDILMKLADVNHITGQWVDALMYLDNAFHTASENKLNGVMIEILLASGTILSKKGKWDIALRKFDQAISLMGSAAHQSLMARALVGKGVISWRKGAGPEAIQYAKKAMSMVAEKDREDIMGSAQALIATAAFDMGDYDLSLKSNDKAFAHFQGAGNQMEMTRVLNNTGETYKLMGDYARAKEFFTQGLSLSGGSSPRSAAYLLTNIAECHARQGQNTDARTFIHMADEKAQGVQDDYLHSMLKFVWALIHESENDHEKAAEQYLSAMSKMRSMSIPFDTGMIQMAYARFLFKQSKADEASKQMEDAVTSFRKAGSQLLLELAEAELAKFNN